MGQVWDTCGTRVGRYGADVGRYESGMGHVCGQRGPRSEVVPSLGVPFCACMREVCGRSGEKAFAHVL